MRFRSVFVVPSLLTLSCLLAPACSDDALDGDDDSPSADASRRDSSTDSSTRDAAPDARRDATTADAAEEDDAAAEEDAGEGDAGPPEPGDACATVGERFERACGTCGLQTAVCTAAQVVGGYGACVERHPSFCESPADAGSDAGETDAGSDAGDTDAGDDAGEADAGSDAGEPPVDTWDGYSIDIDFAVGASGTIALPTATGSRNRIRPGVCPAQLTAGASSYPYALVRFRNTTAQSVTVDLNVLRGFGPTDVVLAVYGAPPSTDADFQACFGRVDNTSCPDPDGTGFQYLACLTGASAITLPALSSSYAYVTMYSSGAAWNGPNLKFTRR